MTSAKQWKDDCVSMSIACTLDSEVRSLSIYPASRGPFLESPDNLSGPVSYFIRAMFTLKIKILLVLKAKQ